MKISALDAALDAVWAMEEQALTNLLGIAGRESDATPEALEAYRAKTMERSHRARERDGIAILDAIGPLFKRANLMTAFSGATSYEILMQDLRTAADDPKIRAIILNVDSPGGIASGVGELAQAVYELRGTKPIVAYIGGDGCSAAYWLASAADKVVIDPSARLGSIGVQVAFREPAPKAGEKVYRFVSSQSPNKNPEPGSEQADRQIQSTIDAMAAVFIADVARNRGVAPERVMKDFGRGGTLVGRQAVQADMADHIGTFESVFADLAVSTKGRRPR